jgi:hypothetical protein
MGRTWEKLRVSRTTSFGGRRAGALYREDRTAELLENRLRGDGKLLEFCLD